MQLVFKDRWTQQRLTLINSEGIYALSFSFFFSFWHSAALKRVTEKQNQILLEKELQSGKIKNEILKEVERKELKCSIEAERRRSTGKKTRQEQRRIPDYELSNGLWVYHLYFLISLQKGNANGKDGSVLSSVGSIVNTGGGFCGSD